MTDLPRAPLTAAQTETLAIVLDMIVPPSGDARLPGAAEVGVLDHLVASAPALLAPLAADLDRLERLARQRFGAPFAALAATDRQALVDAQRAADPAYLAELAIEAVSCYYQHDRVLLGLGLAARPPFPQGYQVVQGDLRLLEPVRRRGKRFRDA